MTSDKDLDKIEAWLKKNNCAASALGRQICEDHAMISRWRSGGRNSVSPGKRETILTYIEKYPDGIPGYKRGKGGFRPRAGRFTPGNTNRAPPKPLNEEELSTSLPVPSLESLEYEDDKKWIKARAVESGRSIVNVLCEMVELGIKVTKEIERDEELEELEELNRLNRLNGNPKQQ